MANREFQPGEQAILIVPILSRAGDTGTMQQIRVRHDSNPGMIAGFIAKSVRELNYDITGKIHVIAAGERPMYLASRALEIAARFLEEERPELVLSSTIRTEEIQLAERKILFTFVLGWQERDKAA